MSSLWTPEGEHRVGAPGAAQGAREQPPAPSAAARPEASGARGLTEEEAAAQLAELRHQLLATPVEVVVANHAYGLFELAAIHLSERPPQMAQAKLAIDALGALVEGLAGRLGEPEASLVDALSRLRLAFVQLQGEAGAGAGGAGSPGEARGG
jgi:hypothetical protein